ncbi:hypothetical protein [Micromonospora sp. NPDC005324]|uniref:hypothetical protein n=1 Tax=Micromonospora sp. NPDC005324 TaxID=3157033 RepID=UPI0033BDF584
MKLDPLNFEITEDALEELGSAYARYVATASRVQDRFRCRHRIGVMGEDGSADRAACWLRMVSIVEIYVEALLKQLAGELPGRAPGGWSEVIGLLKRHHHVDVRDVAAWETLEACILVRNAVAHGLGRFTAKQFEKAAPRKVRAIGVPVRDGAVVITAASLLDCADICRAFIAGLDVHPRVIAQAQERLSQVSEGSESWPTGGRGGSTRAM